VKARQLIAAGLVLTIAAVLASAANSRAVLRWCGPTSSVTEASGRLARAFRPLHGGQLEACRFGHRGSRKLFTSDWFARPAVAVGGTLVGFAAVVSEGDQPLEVTVHVEDLAKPHLSGGIVLNIGLGTAKVGSLRMKSDAAIAWIQCPVRANAEINASPRPNCVSPGHSVNGVYKRDKNTDLSKTDYDLLDQGKGVDPRSLQLHGSRLTWLHSGAHRLATLR
jgi:hypothetical protein